MAAPVGNQFWRFAENAGRPRIFQSPDELWEKAMEYFDWCDNNPLLSYEWNGKDPVKCELEKMRAYTWTGLYTFLNITTLDWYKEREEFLPIIKRIQNILYTQKFEGAAAGLLNPNIIARDLGLADKSNIESHTTNELIITGSKFANEDTP